VVRDLGVYLDADVITTAQVTAVIRACFAGLCQIGSVRQSLTRESVLMRVHLLIVGKVDCCNTVLARVSGTFESGHTRIILLDRSHAAYLLLIW